jgi:hypothetical protein
LFRTLNSELTKNSNADPLLLSTLKSLIVKAGQDPAMLTSLVLELQDATSEVAKQTAVCALEKMGDDALPFLLDTLEATERNDSNLLLVQDLERAIVGIAQTASPEVAVILKDKLLSENREFTKAVSLALTQCLAQWEKYTDPTQMSAVLPALEILSGMTGSALVKLISGNATKVKAKLKSQLATPPVPVATPPAEIPNPEPVSRPPVK